jgi:ribonuclease P protein component
MNRKYRLRRNQDFQQVRRTGKFYASSLMTLAFIRNKLDHSRFGFVVSKRLGPAVQRNKIKRRVREATRLRIQHIKPGFDLVLIARPPISQSSFAEIEQTLETLLKQADLLVGVIV